MTIHSPVIHPLDDGSSILIYERNGHGLIEGYRMGGVKRRWRERDRGG